MHHIFATFALERQDLSCLYLARRELESLFITIVIVIVIIIIIVNRSLSAQGQQSRHHLGACSSSSHAQTHPFLVLVHALLLVSWLLVINTAQTVCSSSVLAAQHDVILHFSLAGVQIPGGLVDRNQPSPVHPSRPGMGQRVGYPALHHECCPHC